VIDDELVSPDAFALAVRSRASFLARHAQTYTPEALRPYAQLTLLLGVEIEQASAQIAERGLRGAYRWAVSLGDSVHSA
jgi:hypothetical protein